MAGVHSFSISQQTHNRLINAETRIYVNTVKAGYSRAERSLVHGSSVPPAGDDEIPHQRWQGVGRRF